MLAVAPLILLAGSLLNVDAAQLSYFDPQGSERTDLNYRSHGAGSVPRERGEKVLTQETHALGAKDLVALVNQDYQSVREALRGYIEQNLGIEQEFDNEAGLIPKPIAERPPYRGADYPTWPPLDEGLKIFDHIVKQAVSPREYQLTSKPYNRLEAVAGYSEVRIRITDGTALLGKPVTLLQVRRRDYSKERARLHHAVPIPLPYREALAFSLVTDTEVAFIESLSRKHPGMKVRYFVPSRLHDQSYVDDFWAALRRAVLRF